MTKTDSANQTKSWLPYEWFDSSDKLDYKGLPPYWCWYSQLRNSFALTKILEDFVDVITIGVLNRGAAKRHSLTSALETFCTK